jgi:transposase
MDVHSTNYTLCALEPVIGAEDRVFANIQITPDYKNILMFIQNLKCKLGMSNDYSIECGYEAGCLGYSLYNQLTSAGINCVILAPTTMLTQQGKRVKTDARDALMIAQCLAYGGYHPVYIPSETDDSVKEYLRMRDDHKLALKKVKQQIIAFCLRHGHHYIGTKWTHKHISWLKKIELPALYRETVDEYLATYDEQTAKIERFDKRIEEISDQKEYQKKVKELGCLLGIKTHTALSLIVETGDFDRFAKGNTYAAYLGLAPGEKSSGDHINRTGLSKAGNSHLRRLLIESARGICKGAIGHKSKELKSRQEGNKADVIAYADKANTRLRSRYYKMIRHGKKKNVAVAAIARELACFVWGMMTDNISMRA